MSSATLRSAAPADIWPRSQGGSPETVLADLCSVFFASLPRSDQRRRALEYIQGLLNARGRKSIRNIATVLGGPASEQGLHHFVSTSPWNWRPVRRSVARQFVAACPPRAWLIRPMIIPKTGRNSVGVDRRFYAAAGQVLNAQEAVGVWAAGNCCSAPVNWRLHLPDSWLRDSKRRSRAAIPDDIVEEDLTTCTVAAYLEMMLDWGLPRLPVVLDARGVEVGVVERRFRLARVPLLARVSGATRLTVADLALPGLHSDVPIYQIMRAVRDVRRPVWWWSGDCDPVARRSLISTVMVRPPEPRPALPGADLQLVGVTEPGQKEPSSYWLTTLDTAPTDLLQLMSLNRRVDQEFADITDPVGVRDYTGRSFDGWHRHVTLASAAHAVTNMIDRPYRG